MCGIAGFIDNNKDKDCLMAMANAIGRRGPDDEGFYFKNGVGLAHKRLAIIDLSQAGHQPMSFNKKIIIFNGEIYNYKEIRSILTKIGYEFKSESDTEVVLKAFDNWGIDCVNRFRGMFSFALYCEDTKRLFLCRDRVGVKPLYYFFNKNKIAFGSELKCFKSYLKANERDRLDVRAISEFLTFGYISSNLSIIESIKKLPAAHYLLFENGEIKICRYWNIHFTENKDWLRRKEDDIIDELENIIIQSFNYRMVSDVPVGIFLSSGIDSSLVTAVLSKSFSKLNTFTVGFNEVSYDESKNASKIANYLNTNHTTGVLTSSKAHEIFSHLYDIYDEPYGDSSCIPTTFVSQIAKDAGMKVVLSADGGDELFGGYVRYTEFEQRWKQVNRFGTLTKTLASNSLSLINAFQSGFNKHKYERFSDILGAKDFVNFYQHILRTSSAKELKLLFPQYQSPVFEEVEKNGAVFNIMMKWDMERYLCDDILTKVDRATMYHSIEGREPFLDHKIIEFASQLPVHFKIRNGEKKYVLKKLLQRYLPEELFKLPKKGFSVPLFSWIKNDYKNDIIFMLENDLFSNEYLDSKRVSGLLRSFLNDKAYNPVIVWYVYSFQKWYNHWKEIER